MASLKRTSRSRESRDEGVLVRRESPSDDVPVLATDRVSIHFGGLAAISDVTFAIHQGETIGLIGPNGAGKTTLVNLLSGIIAPTEGRILWKGAVPQHWRLGVAARAGVSRTFQGTRVFGGFSVYDNITIAQLNSPRRVTAESILDQLELTHRRDVQASLLPFGEARRLGVGIALATEPEVLLLDEPAAGLTERDTVALGESIQRIRAQGKTVVVVDHNMGFIMANVDRVAVLEGGRMIADGPPDVVQRDERVLAAYLGGSTNA